MSILFKGSEHGSFPTIRNERLTFVIGKSAVRKRISPITKIVLHWTGGENGASSCFNTLKNRNLSVQFHCDRNGVITQYCDADLVCMHAGPANGQSIGIEIDNAGFPPGKSTVPRPSYNTKIRGISRKLLEFLPQQIESIAMWCHDLCKIVGIQKKLLRDNKGEILTDTISPKEVNNFCGIVGHYQISSVKSDPGPQLLIELSKRGFG